MFQGVLGILAIITMAQMFSPSPFKVYCKLIASGILIQFALAFLLLKIELLAEFLLLINRVVVAIEKATYDGTSFVFGYLGGGAAPFQIIDNHATYLLAFRALPLILVFSVLSSVLWYWRILPLVIKGFAYVLQKTFGLSGAIGLSSAANVFVGMVEAPLLIKPHLKHMSRSELFVLMTCGMASVAGTVMALYASFLRNVIENALSHIIIASVMSAPAAIMLALIMVPQEENSATAESNEEDLSSGYDSTMHAITEGTKNGLSLLLNIVATLVVFIALVSLVNQGLALIPMGGTTLSLQMILGYFFAPLAWLIGIPWSEAQVAGGLLGTKTILNELIAYIDLAKTPAGLLSDKSKIIMSYALCGFANLGSLGILIGGMISMVPERQQEILKLAPLTLVSGTLSTCLTGAIVGLLI